MPPVTTISYVGWAFFGMYTTPQPPVISGSSCLLISNSGFKTIKELEKSLSTIGITNKLAFKGVIVRGFQLGLQNKPFNTNMSGYVLSGAAWSGIGYMFYQFVDSNDEVIEERVKRLHEARERRAAATAASASG